MRTLSWTGPLLLAQGGNQPGPGGPFSLTSILIIWLPIGLLFYFLLIRPQRLEQARRNAMLRALKPNDRVLTAGGIYGVVTNVHREADTVTIRVDESTNTKLRVALGAISRVLVEESPAEGKEPPLK